MQNKSEYNQSAPPESPTYSTEGQTEQAYPPIAFSQNQAFSSLAILKDAPTSTAVSHRSHHSQPSQPDMISASPGQNFEAFSNEHIDEAEVAAILLENKTLGWVIT